MVLDMLQVHPASEPALQKPGGFGMFSLESDTSFADAYDNAIRTEEGNDPYRDLQAQADNRDENRTERQPDKADATEPEEYSSLAKVSAAKKGVEQTAVSTDRQKSRHKLEASEAQAENIQGFAGLHFGQGKADASDGLDRARTDFAQMDLPKSSLAGQTLQESAQADSSSEESLQEAAGGKRLANKQLKEHDLAVSEQMETQKAALESASQKDVLAQLQSTETAGLAESEGLDVSLEQLETERQADGVRSSRQATQENRKTLIQIVDLRRDLEPGRLEQLRSEIRSGNSSQGRLAGVAGNAGRSGQNQLANGFSQFGQGQQTGPGNQGGSQELPGFDRFFRGDAAATNGELSFSRMSAGILQPQALQSQQFNADVAQVLNSKFGEYLNSDIVRQAKFILKDGDAGEIRLRLRPEMLGSVQIKLDVQDNVIAARILVENSSVRQVFEQQMEQLAQAFQEAGLELGSMEVSVGGDENSRELNQHQLESVSHGGHERIEQAEAFDGGARMLGMDENRHINLMA